MAGHDDEYYNLRQISVSEFAYDTAIPDRLLDDWLMTNMVEGEDFTFGETEYGTHACTVHVKFLNTESATAFKLRWT